MRCGALLVVGLATACGGSGVDVEIYPPDGVTIDRVELWVAYDECTSSDCPNGIGWTDKDRVSGNIYFLRDESLVVAEPKDDHFVLHLESTFGNRDPDWIGVVGYGKDISGDVVKGVKVLRHVHIPSTTVDIWKVYLHKADPAITDVTTKPPASDRGHRAHVWARQPTPDLAEPTGCLVYQDWDDTEQVWDTEYFVPKTDPDCDGVPIELECNEYWYKYAQAVSTCVADMPYALAQVCGLGGSACIDGSINSKLCAADPSHFTCLPDAFCTCSSMIPADGCIAGATDHAISDGTLPYYECDFMPNSEGAPCTIEYMTLNVPTIGPTCGTPEMHYIDKPFTEPQSSLYFGSGTDQVRFEAKTGNVPCQIVLSWIGGTKSAFASGVTFLINVPYSNGTHAVFPIHVTPSSQTVTCDGGAVVGQCVTNFPSTTSEGLFRCAGITNP